MKNPWISHEFLPSALRKRCIHDCHFCREQRQTLKEEKPRSRGRDFHGKRPGNPWLMAVKFSLKFSIENQKNLGSLTFLYFYFVYWGVVKIWLGNMFSTLGFPWWNWWNLPMATMGTMPVGCLLVHPMVATGVSTIKSMDWHRYFIGETLPGGGKRLLPIVHI